MSECDPPFGFLIYLFFRFLCVLYLAGEIPLENAVSLWKKMKKQTHAKWNGNDQLYGDMCLCVVFNELVQNNLMLKIY